jgi:hypothetical protein
VELRIPSPLYVPDLEEDHDGLGALERKGGKRGEKL